MARICVKPGCSNFVQSKGHCKKHLAELELKRAGMQKHYSGLHRELRVQCFIRDNWTCRDCGWMPRHAKIRRAFPQLGEVNVQQQLTELTQEYKRGGLHLVADHILDIDSHPDLAADLDNYQALCSACHAVKTAKTRQENLM